MTKEDLQVNSTDLAIELLESCVTFMTDHGWQNDAHYGPKGGRCIANTLMDLGAAKHSYLVSKENDAAMPVNIATFAVREVIEDGYGCECASGVLALDSPIPHFNDYHCTGIDQALGIYNEAIKTLREHQG